MPSLLTNNDKVIDNDGEPITDLRIIAILKTSEAWSGLSEAKRRVLYSMLPIIKDPHTGERVDLDVSLHPFDSPYAAVFSDFFHHMTEFVTKGHDTKSWLDNARVVSLQPSGIVVPIITVASISPIPPPPTHHPQLEHEPETGSERLTSIFSISNLFQKRNFTSSGSDDDR